MKAKEDRLVLDEGTVQSHTIYFLRFVLIVAVVFSHARLREVGEGPEGSYSLFVYLFTSVFERLPALVLFSGCLFFRSGFSARIYGKKTEKPCPQPVGSLCVLDVAVLLFTLFLQWFQLRIGEQPGGTCVWDYTAHDWWMAFWGGPIAKQFWFIRNLMVLMLFSPVFYFLARYLRSCLNLFV